MARVSGYLLLAFALGSANQSVAQIPTTKIERTASQQAMIGWRSGMTAMLCALGVMLFGFGARVSGRADTAFVLVSLIAIAAGEIRRTSGVAAREPALSLPMESTVATSVSDEERLAAERQERERLEREREELARQLEQSAAETTIEERLAAL